MKLKRPSKKIIILSCAALIAVGSIFGVVYYKNHQSKILISGLVATNQGLSQESSVDSDNDGLPDWQEALWGTDPHNPDTDGDGTSDGVEVAAGRNPLVKGPKDTLTAADYPAGTATVSGTTTVDNTLTGQLAQNLFANYMAAQNDSTDGSIDSDTQTQIINNVVAGIQPSSITPKYDLTDIQVIGVGSAANIKLYGNNFQNIEQTELQYVADHPNLYNSDPSKLAAMYLDLADQLSKIAVPAPLEEDELDVLNNYYALSVTLNEFNDYTKDPIKGLVYIKQIQDVQTAQVALYTDIATYLNNNGIIFNTDEPGYAWNNYLNIQTTTTQ